MIPESPAHPNDHGVDKCTPLSNNQPLTYPLDRPCPSWKLCQSARVRMILKIKDVTLSDSPRSKRHRAPLRRISNRREKRDPPPEKSSHKVKQVEAPVERPQRGQCSTSAKRFVSALCRYPLRDHSRLRVAMLEDTQTEKSFGICADGYGCEGMTL